MSSRFYTDLNSDTNEQEDEGKEIGGVDLQIPIVTLDVVRNALRGMSRGQPAAEDILTTDLVKDAEDFLVSKLTQIYNRCLHN